MSQQITRLLRVLAVHCRCMTQRVKVREWRQVPSRDAPHAEGAIVVGQQRPAFIVLEERGERRPSIGVTCAFLRLIQRAKDVSLPERPA